MRKAIADGFRASLGSGFRVVLVREAIGATTCHSAAAVVAAATSVAADDCIAAGIIEE